MNNRYNVLCIGVNHVPVRGLSKLKYAETDACTVAKYFAALKNDAEVTLLNGTEATKTNILNWVRECSTIQEELTIIIFFAGHGSAEEDENEKKLERCLWIDSRDDKDMKAKDHKIKTSEILGLLDNPTHRLIFIIDACYNFDPQQQVSIQDIFKKFKESERMSLLKHFVIISASAVNSFALEDFQLKHGVLAYYFLKTISGRYTFFLRKKIAFFKFLTILDKKVRNHRFLTDTGRKRPLKMLVENGLMVHWHDTNFDLPLLEPILLLEDPHKNPFQKKLSQWSHFFKCTRMRQKIRFMAGIAAVALLILSLAHLVIVRIHFQYRGPQSMLQKTLTSKTFVQSTTFYNFLLGYPSLFLNKMRPERVGQDTEKTFTLYLFKHNWVQAFLRKLDEKGKIILLGNYLGEPIHGVGEKQIVKFVLDNYNKGDIFYWHPRDTKTLLKLLQKEYKNLYYDRKKIALQILAELGEQGKTAAVNVFDFKKETDRELRDLFLKHFYSPGFWERNIDDFNLYDYLCLITYGKQVPFPNNNRLGERIGQFLHTIVQSLPAANANTLITEPNKLSEIYGKLKILRHLGSPHFQKKTADILKIAFDPNYILDLILICENFNERKWLLEHYFTRRQKSDIIWTHWWEFTRDLFKRISVKEKSKIIKYLINTKYQLLRKDDRYDLFWNLRDSDPQIIELSDWEKWIKKYPQSRYLALIAIIKMKSPRVFPFIEKHYRYFYGEFSQDIFDLLYKYNNEKTVTLVKKLYGISSPKDKLCCALFLYGKNYRDYSTHIVNFLREAKNRKQNREILSYFYRAVTKALIRMVETNRLPKEELMFLMKDRELFYAFDQLNLRLWPGEVKNILLAANIPHDYRQGIPLLRACEKLPEPYRKKMLVKICRAAMDETFRLNAESSLIRYYPGIFLKMAYKKGYHYQWKKRGRLVDVYLQYSYEELRQELGSGFRFGYYGTIGFILEALIKKQEKGELTIFQLRHILQEFNRPLQRMLLRNLRYYLHKRHFRES